MVSVVLAVALVAAPTVIATFADGDATRTGLVAEVIERPAGQGAEAFAEALIDASGIPAGRPRDPFLRGRPAGRPGYVARASSDGRMISVYYDAAAEEARAGRVCRIIGGAPGFTPERYRAYRWCAGQFGIDTPVVPPPPVK